MRDDSGKVVVNGTGLWMARGKPLAVVGLVLGPICISSGMYIQKLNNLESDVVALKAKVERLEEKAADVLLIQSKVNEANAYATSAHGKVQQLRAELTVSGSLKRGD